MLIERETDLDLLWLWLFSALSDSAPLPLMLRLCDCDWLLNADVLSSSERLMLRECDRLIDGLRDPLFDMDTDFDIEADPDIDNDASTLPLLLCDTDWLIE